MQEVVSQHTAIQNGKQIHLPAELMAPANMVKYMSVAEIMEECGMSKQAATIQYNMIHK